MRVRAYFTPDSAELTGRSCPYARHPKGYPQSRTRHCVAHSSSQSPPKSGHHRNSQFPTGPFLCSQAALAAQGAGNLVAPGLTSSACAAARWRARAAKMSPTPPLFSLPEARTRFTVSRRREGASLTRCYSLPSSPISGILP